MIGFKDRNIVLGVVVVAAIAYAATAILKNRQAYDLVEPPGSPATQTRPLVSPLVPEQERALGATEESRDAELLAQVEHKYRFLFADVGAEHVDELRRRLLERERQIDLRSRDRIDAGIGKILPAERFAYYQALKDSDLEQHRLAEYTGGISQIAPLDERQERIVLDAKLRQKQRYASVMRDVGLDRENPSSEERAYAHARTVEALQQYMEDFLSDVAPALSQDQYTQLKNYETTELTRELSRLQHRLDAK